MDANRTDQDYVVKRQTDEASVYQVKAMRIVRDYVYDHLDKSDLNIPEFGVYVVWFSKTLQNWKCLVSTTLPDQKYYEVTYDGDKGCAYLDTYMKIDNKVVPDNQALGALPRREPGTFIEDAITKPPKLGYYYPQYEGDRGRVEG